ncbi:hypothetical protein KsCSTR_35080 [Candidatus Kuenenia stuttgartiensis]|uniref:Glycosyltransferase 2-like domain-containing protein n=1 Tax=Kuenenia stuttgartiensis TaxID=174633 RepID=Q1Q6W0_KUEST|nr:glycosyltransferase [Candidatus Kuenenia stuttgartiensis]QII12887.1 hypothetical protein KsCSTR_35080 [Candidatus Kuenenia stuttgartiensis]CAJ73303.1 conserved hypothetical protein [Candidatus Kuenenia stuttgartiensis]
MMPKISIIVPNYNDASRISECIRSLLDLNYPKEKLEIIIVDNGSTDNSLQSIKAFPVKLLIEKDVKGSYAARNLGVKNAEGEILAFTDSDCVVDKYWLCNAIKYFAAEDVGGVAGEVRGGEPRTLVEEYQCFRKILEQSRNFKHPYQPFAITANVIYKKNVYDKIGLFENNWISGGDVDFSWRMQIYGNMKLIYASDCIVYHHHRTSPKGLYLQSKRHIYGACLLNTKYDNKFQTLNELNNKLILYSKMFRKQVEKVVFFSVFLLFRKKRIYFLYLSRVNTLGYLKGLIQYRKDKHLRKQQA